MNKLIVVLLGIVAFTFNAYAYQRNETYSTEHWTWVSSDRIAIASSNTIDGTRAVIGFDLVDNGSGVATAQFVYFNDVPFTPCDRVKGKHSKTFKLQNTSVRLSELCYPGGESVYTEPTRRDYDTVLTQLLSNSTVTFNGFHFNTADFEAEVSKMSYLVNEFNK